MTFYVNIIPESFRPIVGGNLRLNRVTVIPNIQVFQQGQRGDGWIYADKRLTFVSNNEHACGEYTFIKGIIPGMNLITDGTNWAHCKDLRSGILELRFKVATHDISQFKNLSLESKVSYEDAVIMYRVITGACQAGTNRFLSNLRSDQVKAEYTIREICELTDGEYGSNIFRSFFKR